MTESDVLVMVLEFNGRRLMSQVVPGGAARLTFDDDAHPEHQAVPGEWIEWTDVPGLVLRYEQPDAGAGNERS
jgi:hypothetical protein